MSDHQYFLLTCVDQIRRMLAAYENCTYLMSDSLLRFVLNWPSPNPNPEDGCVDIELDTKKLNTKWVTIIIRPVARLGLGLG